MELLVSELLLLAYIRPPEGDLGLASWSVGLEFCMYLHVMIRVTQHWNSLIIFGLLSSLELWVHAAPWRALGSLGYIGKVGQPFLKTLGNLLEWLFFENQMTNSNQ